MIPIIIVLAVICLVLCCTLMTGYKRCPDGKIMVIYGHLANGQTMKCITHGCAYVMPVFQSYDFLDLSPFDVDIHLKNALSQDTQRIFWKGSFRLAISVEPQLMQKAAERLLGKPLPYIVDLARDIIHGQIRLVVATIQAADISAQNQRMMDEIRDNCRTELGKIGLWQNDIQLTQTGIEK